MTSIPNLRSELSRIDLFVATSKTQIEGLKLLEKLCSSGAWVPAWIIRDYLKNMTPIDKAIILIDARKLGLNKASTILEEAGADMFRVDERGNSVLHRIVSQVVVFNNTNIIIEDGTGIRNFNVSSSDVNMEEIILREVKFLITHEKGLVTAVNKSKALPLHIAAHLGLAHIMTMLIEAGSDINAVTTSKTTPLHLCAAYGHLDCLEILLDKGANTNIGDQCGALPIHLSVQNGHFQCVKTLIEKGAEIDQYTEYGHSPLHIGILCGQVEIVEMLIQNKVKMDSVDLNGQTPLHSVVCYIAGLPTTDMVMLNQLIQGGASLNIKDNEGNTSLHLAVRRGNADVVKRLIDAGVDVSLTDGAGFTPLQLAEHTNAEECVNVLKKL